MKWILPLMLGLLLVGCSDSIAFPEDDQVFMERESSPAYGYKLEFYPVHILLYGDGRGRITTPINEALYINEEAPHTVDFQVDLEDLESLKKNIENSNFFSLEEDLSNHNSMDGGYTYLTIYTKEGEKRVGGLNPDDKTLEDLSRKMTDLLPEGLYQSYTNDLDQYQKNKEEENGSD